MTIKNIKNNQPVNKSSAAGKSEKSSDTGIRTGKADQGSRVSNSNSDRVMISNQHFENDVQFAKNVYKNLSDESLSHLKKIKTKISDGSYDSEQVHQKLSQLISDDLSTLNTLLDADGDEDAV